MSSVSTGLTRVTVASRTRRVDLALPDGVPLAELVPGILSRAGDDLADIGEQHGGWVLRRGDGAVLPPTDTLTETGVLDGEVLHLTPGGAEWPEPEYDDVVEEIAVGARRVGPLWSPDTTRVAAVSAAGVIVAAAIVGPGGAALRGDSTALLGVTLALVVAGVLAARAYNEALVGAALAAYAMPAASLGGTRLVDSGPIGAPHLLGGGAVLALCAVTAAVCVGHGLRIFTAGATLGALIAASAAVGTTAVGWRASAVLMAAVVIGLSLAPSLAVRLGRLPLPVLTSAEGAPIPDAPAHLETPMFSDTPTPGADMPRATRTGRRPDGGAVGRAVARGDDVLTGMVIGLAVAAVTATWVLANTDDLAGRVLVGVVGVAMLLRARLFVTVRQRVPLLGGGVIVLALPVALCPWPGRTLALVLVGSTIMTVTAGARYRSRAPSPYAGRFADLVDTLCLVSVVPLAGAVLELYGLARELAG